VRSGGLFHCSGGLFLLTSFHFLLLFVTFFTIVTYGTGKPLMILLSKQGQSIAETILNYYANFLVFMYLVQLFVWQPVTLTSNQ
jgi:hypothetical protein